MRPILLLLAFAAGPVAAAERVYSVSDFDRIEVRGPYRVTLATGRASSARAEGSPAALDRVSIDVQGRTLRIRGNPSAWGGNPDERDGPVAVRVTTRDLSAAAVIGPGDLAIDRVGGLRVDLSVSGAGELSVAALQADNAVVGLVGAGVITLGGKAKQLRAAVQGSGDLKASGLTVDDVTLSVEGPGFVEVGAARSAKIATTGAGDIVVGGRPACTVANRGSGTVRCGPAG
ncbi:MAG TPA: head GIN domain-containing protein [Allosphingosinicella sp.]|nr:head GIN domain-containing protein [Allosphingosinicella sp.]